MKFEEPRTCHHVVVYAVAGSPAGRSRCVLLAPRSTAASASAFTTTRQVWRLVRRPPRVQRNVPVDRLCAREQALDPLAPLHPLLDLPPAPRGEREPGERKGVYGGGGQGGGLCTSRLTQASTQGRVGSCLGRAGGGGLLNATCHAKRRLWNSGPGPAPLAMLLPPRVAPGGSGCTSATTCGWRLGGGRAVLAILIRMPCLELLKPWATSHPTVGAALLLVPA